MKLNLPRSVKKFSSDDRGTIAALFGLLAVPMVLSIGFAVDYSRVQAAHRDLQQSVDAAAIAAAVYKMDKKADWDINGSGKSARQVAIDYVRENIGTQHVKKIFPKVRESSSDNTLTVTARAIVPAAFARFAVDKFDISVSATARMSARPRSYA